MKLTDLLEADLSDESLEELNRDLPGWRRSKDQRTLCVVFYFERQEAADDLAAQIRELTKDRGVNVNCETVAEVRLTAKLKATASTSPEDLLSLSLSIDRLATGEQ